MDSDKYTCSAATPSTTGATEKYLETLTKGFSRHARTTYSILSGTPRFTFPYSLSPFSLLPVLLDLLIFTYG